MANPSDGLGIDVDFDNDGFRNAIRFAMQMGANPNPERTTIFIKKNPGRTYKKNGITVPTPRLDRDGKPLDPDIEVIKAADDQIRVGTDIANGEVNVAIEVERADAEELPVGNFRPTKVIVTALDVDYEKIKDCRELIYNGDKYMFGYEPESNGLFEVGVYTLIYYALDES